MKIAVVSQGQGPLAIHVAELCAALTRHGHCITVHVRRDDTELPRHMGPFAQFLRGQWSTDPPDIVHAHSWIPGIAAQLAAKHLDLPAVQTFHTLASTDEPQRRRLETMIARCATSVVVTYSEAADLLRRGRSRTGLSVVPCGVDLDLFTPQGPKATRDADHRIVSVGRLLPCSGFEVVLRALPRMPRSEFVIVGGPEPTELDSDGEACRLRDLAERLGVADRVLFAESVAREGIPELLRSADVVACTPSSESFGTVALEAMACGVPVVATAVGGLRDTVVHDVTGCLVDPHRVNEVGDVINHLLHDEFLRQSLGAAGRDRARARYSWDRIASDTERIYDRLGPSVRLDHRMAG